MSTRIKIGKLLSRGESVISALLGQASSSISSVLISAWLIFFGTKEDFGTYSIYFSISLVCAGLISSAFTIQYAVHLPAKRSEDHAVWFSIYQLIIASTCAIGAALASAVVAISGHHLDAALICGSITWAISARELVIRHLVYREDHSAVRISSTILLVSSCVLLIFAPTSATPIHWAGFAYSASIFFSVTPSLYKNLPRTTRTSNHMITAALKESWSGGRWGIISTAFFSIRNQAHTLLLAPLGASIVADVNAARLVFMPMFQIAPVISQVGLSVTSKLRSSSELRAIEYGRRLATISVTPILVYGIAVSLAPALLKESAIPAEYWSAIQYLPGWCLVTCAMAARIGYSTTLQALHQFKTVASGNLASIAALLGTWVLLQNILGSTTVLYAMAASEVCVTLVYMYKLRRMRAALLV